VKILFATFFVIILIASALMANTANTSASTHATQTADTTEKVKGKVKKIDKTKHTIKVKVDDQEKTYKISFLTRFVKDEKPVDPSTLKIGDKVVVTTDSKNFAHKVKIETHSSDKSK